MTIDRYFILHHSVNDSIDVKLNSKNRFRISFNFLINHIDFIQFKCLDEHDVTNENSIVKMIENNFELGIMMSFSFITHCNIISRFNFGL